MISNFDLPKLPLPGAGGVLASSVALFDNTGSIFVDFSGRVGEGANSSKRWWQAWHRVLIVRNSELIGECGCGECGVVAIANSRLAEVDHIDTKAFFNKGHAGKLGKCATQTVACNLYRVVWIL